MIRFDDLDRTLAAYLDGEAATALVPDGLLSETLSITAVRSPRVRWHAQLSAQRTGATWASVPGGPPVAIALVLLALLGAVFAFAIAAGSPRPALRLDVAPNPVASAVVTPSSAPATTSAPVPPSGASHRITDFPRPFRYRDLAPTALTKVGMSGWILAFTSTGHTAYPPPPIGRDGTYERGAWGITISSARGVFAHSCSVNGSGSRVHVVGREARLFLEDLRTIAGIEFGELVETTFDGRPAIAATVDPDAARCLADFHVFGGSLGGYVQLRFPSRLVVTDVDGMPIVFQVWGATQDDLDAAMPAAASFLEGIHFTGESSP